METSMAKRHLEIRPEWGEAIRAGRKDLDARLAADIADLKVGDIVRYPAVHARVLRIARYRGYRDLLATEDWRRIAPDASGADEALRLLESGQAGSSYPTEVAVLELEVSKE
jgi:ASC-1-like (ASCH) protein